jgi:hypothetical protein
MIDKTKVVQLVLSERGDFWIEDLQLAEEETLRHALQQRGFNQFIVVDINPDDAQAVKEGMTLRVHIVR